MSYNFKINSQNYTSLSFYTSFDKETKELAFFIHDSSTEQQKNFLNNKLKFKLTLMNEIVDFFILEANNQKYAFEFNKDKDIIKKLFFTKELKIGFAFQDNDKNLIKDLCFTVDY